MVQTLLQRAIDEALTQSNIDLILPALLEGRFFVVGHKADENEGAGFWLVPSQDDPDQMVLTVSETQGWLEDTFADNPQKDLMEFMPVTGVELMALALETKFELIFFFEDGAYRMPRSYLDYWAEALKNPED